MIDNNDMLAKQQRNIELSGQQKPAYVVVTPAFNEEKNIKATIHSMISQTLKPQLWVIVDDGSSDKTWEIISLAAELYSWVKAYHRSKNRNRGNAHTCSKN